MRARPSLVVLALLLTPVAARAEGVTERYYETTHRGQKVGYSKVTWAPSTWEGRKTLHDTTRVVRRSVRNMGGVKNVFETTITIELERDPDGTLWWERITVREGERTLFEELTWTGDGYLHVSGVVGGDERRLEISAAEPVMTDAESFVGHLLRQGRAAPGDSFELPLLDVRGRGVRTSQVEVVGREAVEDVDGEVLCTKVVERDQSGAETILWLDADGAFVRIQTDAGSIYRRVSREAAEEMPVEPAEYDITTPASPSLERLFTADVTRVRLHLQGDPDRGEPEFPASPWSRVRSVSGSDEEGWVYELELRSYDRPDAAATLDDVDRERFARELEPTVIMPCRDPRIVAVAREVVGDETNIRRAAYLLARYVYTSLQKRSPDVSEATALEILDMGQGDCSEHATLFVTLCRALGIPTRRCSGYVCLGSLWGAHAWAEIWAGDWLPADPTTGEVGAGARYLFYGYDDTPGSYPGVVASRASGRMRLVTTYVEEDGVGYELTGPESHALVDPAAGRTVHVLCGLEARGAPADWQVQVSGDSVLTVRGPSFYAYLMASADQGADLERFGRSNGTFAGAPAIRHERNGRITYVIHSRRRLIRLLFQGDTSLLPELERVLAPSFAPSLSPAAEVEEEPAFPAPVDATLETLPPPPVLPAPPLLPAPAPLDR